MDDILLIQNDRDRRALAWLIDQVGEDAIRQAVGRLAGERKPFVSNVAKVLSVKLPRSVELTPACQARKNIAAIKKAMLK